MKLPDRWLRHTIVVEPFLGTGGDGPLYGPPVTVRCHLESSIESQREDPDRGPGESTMGIAQLADAAVIRLDARATVDGRQVEIRTVKSRTYPGMPAPEHVEFTVI